MNIDVEVTMYVALVAHRPASTFDPVTYEFVGVYDNFAGASAAIQNYVGVELPEFKWMGSDSSRYAIAPFADHTRAAHIKQVKV